MAKINDGGPAFPHQFEDAEDHPRFKQSQGMTLRDYFAIHAPEPSRDDILSVMKREQMANPHNEPYHNKVRRRGEQEIRCALRFEFADAMLAERAKASAQ